MRLWILLSLLGLGCTGTVYSPSLGIGARDFSPEPLIEGSTRRALVRWVKASGISLGVYEVGVPINTQEDWIYLDGNPNCGHTDLVESGIMVSTKRERCNYFSFDSLLVHEIGHAVAGIGGHSKTGIMAEGGKAENRECIDSSSLELICNSADCEIFEPECP